MLFYQSPFISSITQGPFQSQTQYIPDCSGTPCGEVLGITNCDSDPGILEIDVTFFFPSTSTTEPNCVILDGAVEPQDCTLGPSSLCGDGRVWQINCSYAAVDCDPAGGISVSCEGESSTCNFIPQ